jgi:hypothetical protein
MLIRTGGPTLGGIVTGALGAALAVGAGVPVAQTYRRRRWQRTLWAFRVPAREPPTIILETIEGDETGVYRRPTAGLGAVKAFALLAAALDATRDGWRRRTTRSVEHPIALVLSADVEADRCTNTADTVVVGGPKANLITRQLLQAFGCQPPCSKEAAQPDELLGLTGLLRGEGGPAAGLGVATVGNEIFWFGERYAGRVTEVESLTGAPAYEGHDYGVVIRLPSPLNPRRRTVVVFGSQTFGVAAAATWLTGLRSRRVSHPTRRVMARNRNIAALVKVGVERDHRTEPELIDLVPLPDHLEPRHW